MTDGRERSGLLLALAGYATLSLGDALIKSMAGQWAPTAVGLTRYVLGAAGLSAMLGLREGRAGFRVPTPAIQLVRGGGVALATTAMFAALFVMPLAAATALMFTSPIFTALLAAVVLGEPLRRETVLASLLAFAGALVVLRPNFAAVGWAALLPLAAALGMSALVIGNRLVAGKGSALAMQASVALAAVPVLAVATLGLAQWGGPKFALHWPAGIVLAKCAAVACSATLAHWLIYLGTTRVGAGQVAPMSYVQLLVASVLGWAVFGNRPDALTLAGAGVIVMAGLVLWRGGAVSRRPAQPAR